MTEKKKKFRISPLVWLVGIPIVSFIIIIILANGIRELISPEWFPIKWIPLLSWIELILIGILSIISIFCLLILFFLVLRHVSIDKLEDEFYRIKNR